MLDAKVRCGIGKNKRVNKKDVLVNYSGWLGKLEGFANFSSDLGAQWLHSRSNILGDLVKKTKTKVTRDGSEAKMDSQGNTYLYLENFRESKMEAVVFIPSLTTWSPVPASSHHSHWKTAWT